MKAIYFIIILTAASLLPTAAYSADFTHRLCVVSATLKYKKIPIGAWKSDEDWKMDFEFKVGRNNNFVKHDRIYWRPKDGGGYDAIPFEGKSYTKHDDAWERKWFKNIVTPNNKTERDNNQGQTFPINNMCTVFNLVDLSFSDKDIRYPL